MSNIMFSSCSPKENSNFFNSGFAWIFYFFICGWLHAILYRNVRLENDLLQLMWVGPDEGWACFFLLFAWLLLEQFSLTHIVLFFSKIPRCLLIHMPTSLFQLFILTSDDWWLLGVELILFLVLDVASIWFTDFREAFSVYPISSRNILPLSPSLPSSPPAILCHFLPCFLLAGTFCSASY